MLEVAQKRRISVFSSPAPFQGLSSLTPLTLPFFGECVVNGSGVQRRRRVSGWHVASEAFQVVQKNQCVRGYKHTDRKLFLAEFR